GVNRGSVPRRRRIDGRSTFGAERLWPLIPAFAGLFVNLQFARKQLESILAAVRDNAERGTRSGVAVGAIADQGLVWLDFGFVAYVSAVATPVDFHLVILRNSKAHTQNADDNSHLAIGGAPDRPRGSQRNGVRLGKRPPLSYRLNGLL